MKERKTKNENIAKYGEEIPTSFAWVGLNKQKNIAKKLANISKKIKNQKVKDKKESKC